MSKKSYVLMVVAAAFLVFAAAQPAVAQTLDDDNDTELNDDEFENETEDLEAVEDDNETEDMEEFENETREYENETERERQRERSHAQFDARLMTAIKTVDALVEIAPNDNASERLESALEIMKGVQEDTDTSSLGPEDMNRTRDRDRDMDEERREDRDEYRNRTDRENETQEGAGDVGDSRSDEQGPPEDVGSEGQGPSGNSNRPGFVSRMLGGLFG